MTHKKILSGTITAALVLSTLLSALCVHADPQNNSSVPTEQLNTELVQSEKTEQAEQPDVDAHKLTDKYVSREELAQILAEMHRVQHEYNMAQHAHNMAMLQQTQLANFQQQQLINQISQLNNQIYQLNNKPTSKTAERLKLLASVAPHIIPAIKAAAPLVEQISLPTKEQAMHMGKVGGCAIPTAFCAYAAYDTHGEVSGVACILACLGAYATYRTATGK